TTPGPRWSHDGGSDTLRGSWSPALPEHPPTGPSKQAQERSIPNAPSLLIREPDLEGPIAFLGGLYSNHIALRAVIADARRRGARRIFCLGDLGGFGPNPGKIYPILEEFRVTTVAGNYDESLAMGLPDCGCGYTHPSDNFFAQLSYDYTNRRTTDA